MIKYNAEEYTGFRKGINTIEQEDNLDKEFLTQGINLEYTVNRTIQRRNGFSPFIHNPRKYGNYGELMFTNIKDFFHFKDKYFILESGIIYEVFLLLTHKTVETMEYFNDVSESTKIDVGVILDNKTKTFYEYDEIEQVFRGILPLSALEPKKIKFYEISDEESDQPTYTEIENYSFNTLNVEPYKGDILIPTGVYKHGLVKMEWNESFEDFRIVTLTPDNVESALVSLIGYNIKAIDFHNYVEHTPGAGFAVNLIVVESTDKQDDSGANRFLNYALVDENTLIKPYISHPIEYDYTIAEYKYEIKKPSDNDFPDTPASDFTKNDTSFPYTFEESGDYKIRITVKVNKYVEGSEEGQDFEFSSIRKLTVTDSLTKYEDKNEMLDTKELHLCRSIIIYNEKIYLWDSTLAPNKIFNSYPKEPAYFPQTYHVICGEDTVSGVIMVQPFKELLIASTKNSTYSLTEEVINNNAVTLVKTIDSQYGCTSRFGAVVLEDKLYTLTHAGLYSMSFNPYSSSSIVTKPEDYNVRPSFPQLTEGTLLNYNRSLLINLTNKKTFNRNLLFEEKPYMEVEYGFDYDGIVRYKELKDGTLLILANNGIYYLNPFEYDDGMIPIDIEKEAFSCKLRTNSFIAEEPYQTKQLQKVEFFFLTGNVGDTEVDVRINTDGNLIFGKEIWQRETDDNLVLNIRDKLFPDRINVKSSKGYLGNFILGDILGGRQELIFRYLPKKTGKFNKLYVEIEHKDNDEFSFSKLRFEFTSLGTMNQRIGGLR